MKLYLASGNAHKAREFQALADQGALPVAIVPAAEAGGMPAVTEDAGSFAGNALKKARALRDRLPPGGWALADDSGLCVDALEGGPGVESAYYAGPRASGAENLAKLVSVLRELPEERRTAHFVCVLALAGPGGEEHVFKGRCDGRLRREPAGTGGFGYDPVFVPEGFDRTFAELGDEAKNTVSHRRRAWAELAAWLHENLR
ncbi:MAG: non-canonical purine NTP pyrophosphatase, RdgB/HAM1 family [Verrucomicrobia bacterium RIFCSPLOWO2_12_FULL_64_8]|nr:MAG: non-canonical purine NTP pyrophosphatase, RdgB/HAM1 family [Verrucomicrobia bacterium RIFCSPLOWO2_12_FULL_64_8]